MADHLEVEETFEAPVGSDLPVLSGLPGVASVTGPEQVELEATYFDTAGLDLVGAGITLRRRVGGEDEGWHVKLPTGTGRWEVHHPAGEGRLGAVGDPHRAGRRDARPASGAGGTGTHAPCGAPAARRRRHPAGGGLRRPGDDAEPTGWQ